MMCIKTIPVLAFLLLFISCSEAPPDYAILQGNLPVGTAAGKVGLNGEMQDILVGEDGIFLDTLQITSPAYVDLELGDFSFWIYLEPGNRVSIIGDSTLSFEGDNAEVNAYLYHDVVSGQSPSRSFDAIFQLEEEEFLQQEDSLRLDKLNRMAELPAGTEAFQNFHKKGIEYDYKLNVARYPMYHGYFVEGYSPTETITSVYQEEFLDNGDDFQRYGAYRALVNLLLDQRANEMPDTSLIPLEKYLGVLADIKSPSIIDERLKGALYYYNVHVDNPEEFRHQMLASATQEETKASITKRYELIRQLQPGSPSPNFNYENYAGGQTKLTDLKGKYVYIDVWATWCSPCIREIPHLKEMEETFHDANISFVSISIDELKFRNKWRNMVTKRELGGIQLLADKDWNSEFIRSFGIRGIPHFILLDEQGNIISADVERPSDPRLEERLRALASK